MDSSSSKRRKTGPEPDWSAIPGEILGLIAGKSASVDDLVRFSAVCRPWNSAAAEFNIGPVYMTGAGPGSRRVALRNPNSAAATTLDLPETAGSRCWGSPFGWLVTFEPADLRFNLLNPFTGAAIALPSLPKSGSGGRRLNRVRAFLTANPETDPDDCLVVIVFGWRKSKLAFVRPGRQNWTHVDGGFNLIDLVRYNGELYGLEFSYTFHARLFSIQLNHRGGNGRVAPRAVQTLTLNPTPQEEGSIYAKLGDVEKHLVDLNGELCLCVRYFNFSSTIGFKIFKINLSNGNLTRIMSLGDHCLFLGNNYSFSWKATYIPTKLFEQPRRDESRELVSNCVFYAYYYDWHDRHCGRPWVKPPLDVEVWDMSRSAKVCELNDSQTLSYGPLWILPPINFSKLKCDDKQRAPQRYK